MNVKLLGVLSASLFIAACGGSSSSTNNIPNQPPSSSSSESSSSSSMPAAETHVRVFHGSFDAPKVNIWVNEEPAITELDYEESSGVVTLPEGTYNIAVEAIIPGGNAVVIGPADFELAADTLYDVIAVGGVAEETLEPLILADDGMLSDDSMVRVRVAHLAAAAPGVDVYVTAPDADFASADPLGSFEFKETLGPVEVAAGDYRIRVAVGETVVFDSGAVSLMAGKDLLIGAIPNVATGDSPIRLAVLDGDDVVILSDVGAGADLRAVHAVSDAPGVDILVNNAEVPAVSNLEFPDFTGYLNLEAGSYNFKVTVSGTLTPAVIDADVALYNGSAYTLLAVGALDDDSVAPLLLTDNNRSIATEAKVRLVHASTLAGPVDIYVLPAETEIGDNEAAFSDVPFAADTGYVSLAAGSYRVAITPAGSTDVAIDATLEFMAGGIYTAVARDGENLTTPLGVIGLDGLAPSEE